MFIDGAEVANDTTKYTWLQTQPAGDGRIVVGRIYTDKDERYTSLQLDELIFFNKALSTTDITAMYNAV